MAEQEACAELVEKATSEGVAMKQPSQGSNTVHGESLLLPLLQGLLDTPNTTTDNDQHNDSGTESGEDLRSGLIIEVQSALDKLSTSLKNPNTNIAEDKRDSLLGLVTRLQAGLSSQITPSSSGERRSSLQGKFSRRKHQRSNRHTVGVSTEELENARRLMEEISLQNEGGNLWLSKEATTSPLQKQNSEGSVLQTPFKSLKTGKPVQNITAKPFISSNATSQSQSGTSSTVETPSETSGSLEFLLEPPLVPQPPPPPTQSSKITPQFHHSMSLDYPTLQPPPPIKQEVVDNKKRLTETKSLDFSCNRDVDLVSIQKAVTQAAAIKQLSQMNKSDVSEDAVEEDESEESGDEEDDASTVKTAKEEVRLQQQPDLIMQTNPTYNKPVENKQSPTSYNPNPTQSNLTYNKPVASPEEEKVSEDDEYPTTPVLNEKANRFNSKKLKMKRANTIDIPKPLKYYEEYDDEDEYSENEDATNNNRRNSYLALRGPIRVGKIADAKKVPEFEPKTESDRKFMAFLGKHSDNANAKNTSIWCKQQPSNHVSNWNNKFGNIKNNFEKVQVSNSVNSARNFWKSADDSVSAGRVSNFGPKISRQSARNLQQMFEEKQKQNQQLQQRPLQNQQPRPAIQQQKSLISSNFNNNIVTGSLKVADTVAVVTQPNSINKFSHAPMSAFKPVKKIDEPTFLKPKPIKMNHRQPQNDKKEPDSPLYLYSPKHFSPETSPVHFAPSKNLEGGRVLSLVAAKFENKPSDYTPIRKMSKEKIAIPPVLQAQSQRNEEKLTAPYLVKSVGQSNTVRKLSGQYDSLNKEVPLIKPPQQSRVFMPGENYTIQYNNPVVSKPVQPPRVYNAEYTITQHHYYDPPIKSETKEYQPNQRQEPHRVRTHSQSEIDEEQAQIHNELQQAQIRQKQQQQDELKQAQIRQQQQQSYKYQAYSPSPPVEHYKPYSRTQPEIYENNTMLKSQPEIYESGRKLQSQPEVYENRYEDDHQYTSNYHFRPQMQQQKPLSPPIIFDKNTTPPSAIRDTYSYKNPEDSYESAKPASYERQTSTESVKEYTAVSSKVMSGPVSQTAVTVQNSPKNREQHDMEMHLKASLQKVPKKEVTQQKKEEPPPLAIYNNVKRPSVCINDKPFSLESFEINEKGENILTSKFHIPVIKQQPVTPPIGGGHELSKSESWHQICQQSSASKPSPRASPSTRSVARSKSSHTLALPKQFEAGNMSKTEMLEKKRTMEAYFGVAKPKEKKTSINRVKTSQKISTQKSSSSSTTSSGLCRSKTLPDIVCLDKLDEKNIDDIFEDLFNAST